MLFLIISAIILLFIVFKMPKKIPRIDLYATTGMATYFQLVTDVFLHIKLNWYGYFKQSPKTEWETLWLIPLYLSINPLFLNFYPYQKGRKKEALYILGWTIFSVIYEWIASQTGMFYHNEWKLYHSALTYPFLFILLRLQLELVQRLRKKDQLFKETK